MATAEPSLTSALVGFGRALRRRGVAVGPGQLVRYQQAVAALDAGQLEDLYWSGRACLVTRKREQPIYDEVFASYFLNQSEEPQAGPVEPAGAGRDDRKDPQTGGATGRREIEKPAAEANDGDEGEEGRVGAVTSPVEILRSKAFPECTPEELAVLRELLQALRVSIPLRLTRRARPGRAGRELDLRRSLRRSLRTHGDLFRRNWRRRTTRPRPLVLLLDVSGSMTGYSRALLQFAYSLAGTGSRMEVFCFGTRLTRITETLRGRDPDAALEESAATVVDWDGGTRIGESLRDFLRNWGRQGFVRGSVVVVCSDGLERGDPAMLASQMERLGRLAYRIVWVNPLKGDPGYVPAARGMRAALPHVNHLVAGDTLASLERLGALLHQLR